MLMMKAMFRKTLQVTLGLWWWDDDDGDDGGDDGDDGGDYEDDDAEKENKEEKMMVSKMISQATLVTPGLCLGFKWLPSLPFSPGDCQQDYYEDVSGCQDYHGGIHCHRCDLANSDLVSSSEDWFL